MFPPLIMIVNDDHLVLALFSLLLRKAGYRSVTHHRSTDVDDRIMQLQPALLILDIIWRNVTRAGRCSMDCGRILPRSNFPS